MCWCQWVCWLCPHPIEHLLLYQELWFVAVLPLSSLSLNIEVLPSPTPVKQMRRRVRFGKRRRTVGRITQYFQGRKSARRPVNSCPNPTFDTVYSSSSSNSVTLV
ncbi:hypothetical protein TIFTF001_034982 [Ficus carica]|uniref:Uncharacterized protein n=1 Tax=Ficus carica TaxID=3494 RepID=A0AA88JB81_FICCA|nr:hypothetical protein TIFTF001_034982 [Ficus carica]